jgi:hypothetical protein
MIILQKKIIKTLYFTSALFLLLLNNKTLKLQLFSLFFNLADPFFTHVKRWEFH